MKLKKLIAVLGMCVVVVSASTSALAAENSNQTETNINEENVVQPRVNWTGNARLSTDGYYNVTSSNNIFKDSPKVTNHAGNPGTIKVRIINGNGKQVGSTKEIKVGKTVTMDQIPAFSGTYTLQAKAVSEAGSYTITID